MRTKTRIAQLEARIGYLERALDAASQIIFDRREVQEINNQPHYIPIESRTASVKKVVELILEHLGLEIKVVEIPKTTQLQKRKIEPPAVHK